jgi:hypothetical protein
MSTIGIPLDAALLARLHDIIEPAAPELWPLAPGWILVIALLGLLLLRAAQFARMAWRQNAYRRQAAAELAQLQKALDASTAATSASQALSILRRCALHVAPRHDVAALTGSGWANFLASRIDFPISDELGALLFSAAYQPARRVDAISAQRVLDFAQRWVTSHRPT